MMTKAELKSKIENARKGGIKEKNFVWLRELGNSRYHT